MQGFPFHVIIMHTSDQINYPEENLQSLLNLLPMFKIRIIYDETIGIEDVTESVGIMCINCGKFIFCLLDNQTIKTFITPFVVNMVLHLVGLSCIIR